MSDKVKVSVLEVNGVEEGEGPAERSLTSDIVDFTDIGGTYKTASDDVQAALAELRTTLIHDPAFSTTTLNGTVALTFNSKTLCIISGTATGYTVKLPDATTLHNGRVFEIINSSNQTIQVDDGMDGLLVTLIASTSAVLVLKDNSTAAGVWLLKIISTEATGIFSNVLTSDTNFNTTSEDDEIITGFSVIPLAGRYFASYSAEITITQNNRLAQATIYVGGSAITNTKRKTQGLSNNFESSAQTIGEITVDGLQSVDVRVAISGGDLDVDSRSLILIRLGS